ncbi:hypothetical protein HZH66_002524 [Vespula vulgaris]|uniref:Uncharacterized protein n=2 Tax=Vespula TaxID=7451 RepID=A0A834PB95_VESPE|nr:hypothetical protein HZH66_002524 [Vespula vulgaris]KAF7434935.1 hypothetical protein H0235_003126 [Vespula pensylvanica]
MSTDSHVQPKHSLYRVPAKRPEKEFTKLVPTRQVDHSQDRVNERASPHHHHHHHYATKIIKANNKIDTHDTFLINRLNQEHSKKDQKHNANTKTVNGKINNELRGRPKKKKRRRIQRALMALLLAYKLKFIALIPTILGGLILLIGKALLTGFFFSIFAAVLSLKSH